MGVISRVIGGAEATQALGEAAEGVAEVFVPNATRKMEISAEIQKAAMAAMAAEYEHGRVGVFDQLMNGLNRLPRPMLALGTIGLFVFAMVDPAAFAVRMEGLSFVPEPLWWLLGAIVSFYFGARELYYFRTGQAGPGLGPAAVRTVARSAVQTAGGIFGRRRRRPDGHSPDRSPTGDNAALHAWRSDRSAARD